MRQSHLQPGAALAGQCNSLLACKSVSALKNCMQVRSNRFCSVELIVKRMISTCFRTVWLWVAQSLMCMNMDRNRHLFACLLVFMGSGMLCELMDLTFLLWYDRTTRKTAIAITINATYMHNGCNKVRRACMRALCILVSPLRRPLLVCAARLEHPLGLVRCEVLQAEPRLSFLEPLPPFHSKCNMPYKIVLCLRFAWMHAPVHACAYLSRHVQYSRKGAQAGDG